jgi:hypothetical protein
MEGDEEITIEGDDSTAVEEAPVITTVIVDTPSEATETAPLLDIVERLTRVEGRLDSVETTVMEHGFSIADLQVVEEIQNDAIVETAVVVAEEVVEDKPSTSDELESDEAPLSKVHKWWRSRGD